MSDPNTKTDPASSDNAEAFGSTSLWDLGQPTLPPPAMLPSYDDEKNLIVSAPPTVERRNEPNPLYLFPFLPWSPQPGKDYPLTRTAPDGFSVPPLDQEDPVPPLAQPPDEVTPPPADAFHDLNQPHLDFGSLEDHAHDPDLQGLLQYSSNPQQALQRLSNMDFLSGEFRLPIDSSTYPIARDLYSKISFNLTEPSDAQFNQHVTAARQQEAEAQAQLGAFRQAVSVAKLDEMNGGTPISSETFIPQYITDHPDFLKAPRHEPLLDSLAQSFAEESRWTAAHGDVIKALNEDLRDTNQLQSDAVVRNSYVTQMADWSPADQQKALNLWAAYAERDPDEKAYATKLLSQAVRRTGGAVEAGLRAFQEISLDREASQLRGQPATPSNLRRLQEIARQKGQIALDRNLTFAYNDLVNPNRSNAPGWRGALANAGLDMAKEAPPLLLAQLRGVGTSFVAVALSLEQKEKLQQKYPAMTAESALTWGTIQGTLHAIINYSRLSGMSGRFGPSRKALANLDRLPFLKRLAGKVGVNALAIQGSAEADLLVDPVVEWIASQSEPSMKDFDAAKEFGQVFNEDTQLQALLSSAGFAGLGAAGHGFIAASKAAIRSVREVIQSGKIDRLYREASQKHLSNDEMEAQMRKLVNKSPDDIKIKKPQDWFKLFGKKAKIFREGESIEKVFGSEISDKDLTLLSGATSNSIIFVACSTTSAPEISFKIINRYTASQDRVLKREPDGSWVLYNLIIDRSERDIRGYGAHSLASQVKVASKMGINRIETLAYRGKDDDRWIGPLVWPKLGYNAPLNETEIEMLPDWLSNARTISDIISTQNGIEWWAENGFSKVMYFNLNPDSYSFRVLKGYLKSREYLIKIDD